MMKNLILAFSFLVLSEVPLVPASFYVDPRDAPYNAICTPGVDNSVPLQTALSAAAAQNLSLLAPPGGCDFGTELHVDGVSIFGTGPGRSGFRMLSAAQNGLVVVSGTTEGGGSVIFRDFFIKSATTPTSGAAILVDPGSSNVNTGSRFENVAMPNAWDGFVFNRAAFYTIRDPNLGEPTLTTDAKVYHIGITVKNLVQEDYGDSLITGGLIAMASGSVDGIYQESSAGLKVALMKIVGAPQNCFHFKMQSSRSMGPLIVGPSNSLEGCQVNGIFVEQGRGGLSVNGVVLSGNQIGCGVPSTGCIGINTTTIDGEAWLRNPVVNGNSIMNNAAQGGAAGMTLDGMDNPTVTGNSLFNASVPNGWPFIFSSHVRNGYVGKNSVVGYLNPCIVVTSVVGPTIRYEAATPCL